MTTVTQWFSVKKKPARKGVYEVKPTSFIHYAYWDGKEWKETAGSVFSAFTSDIRSHDCYTHGCKWRGVAK